MKTVCIFSLLILAFGMLCGFLTEGPFGVLVGFLLASGLCVAVCYVVGIIADNRVAADPPREYVVYENPPKSA